ncbi:MAG: hypothetical protein U0168_15070 [Nannocystaceae bacterium]
MTRMEATGWWVLFGGVAVGTLAGVLAGLAERQEDRALRLSVRYDLDTGEQPRYADVQREYEDTLQKGRAQAGGALALAIIGASAIVAGITDHGGGTRARNPCRQGQAGPPRRSARRFAGGEVLMRRWIGAVWLARSELASMRPRRGDVQLRSGERAGVPRGLHLRDRRLLPRGWIRRRRAPGQCKLAGAGTETTTATGTGTSTDGTASGSSSGTGTGTSTTDATTTSAGSSSDGGSGSSSDGSSSSGGSSSGGSSGGGSSGGSGSGSSGM